MSESLVALSPTAHNRLRFMAKADFSFAKKNHACPIMMSEVPRAAQSYPVVFSPAGGVVVPQMLFSVRPGINPAVAEDGSWQGGYIPLHLRRYPFFLGREKGADQAVLMIDKGAPQLGDEGKLLYNRRGGKYVPSPTLKQVKDSLTSFDREYQRTRALCGLLQKAGVLRESRFDAVLDGKKQVIRGFSSVDWDAVCALDDATLASWARMGLVQLIHAHLQSIATHFPMTRPRAAQDTDQDTD